jgi:hypothetical protein
MQAGLQKMVEAKEDVNKMKAELAIKNQELAIASKEAEVLLKSISESTAIAEKGKCMPKYYYLSIKATNSLHVLWDHVWLLFRADTELPLHLRGLFNAATQNLFYCSLLVSAEKQKVAVIVDAVSTKAAEIAAVKDDAERDLAAAKPALEEALAALNSITPKDITSLKALKSPPDIIKRIFDCVLLLRYWPIGEKVHWGLQGTSRD